MLAVVVVIAVVTVVAGFMLLGLGRRNRFSDVERFHRASAMTSEWARTAVTRPVIAAQETPADAERRAEPRPSRANSGRAARR